MRLPTPVRSILHAAFLFLLTAPVAQAQAADAGAVPPPDALVIDASVASLRGALVVPLVATGDARAAEAQTAAPAQPPAAPFTAGWRNGFFLESADGQFSLRVRLLVQGDGRFDVTDTDNTFSDTFLLRRVRPSIQGRVLQRFEFNLNPDYAGNALNVLDAYIDTRFNPAFGLRVGKAKAPFGLERLHSAGTLLFYERALPTAMVPNRDIGVQAFGSLAGGRVSYQAALLNGVADGGSIATTDNEDGKDVVGRVVVQPVGGFGIGVAASRGTQPGVGNFSTPSIGRQFVSYAGATGEGVRVRYSPQAFLYRGPLGAFGEYVHSTQTIRRGAVADDVAHVAWQVAASWVLTGENATEGGVRPRANVGGGGIGAFQVAARVHSLRIDPHAIALGLAAAGSSRKAEAFTVGLNWYLNPFVKYVLNIERTVFDDNATGARPAETAVAFRAQLGF